MGKQRSKILRRNAEALLALYPEKFSEDFEANKKALDELKMFPTKISRNIVAGILSKITVHKEL
ncbi:30S ribosomal protein S17e [Candidatus Micrarchaeota archaeon]|nr:30S ribosomal protein S17e [Candidatus Micrarchaeota archaeon]